MSKLFPSPLAVAPVFPVSRDCQRTGLDGPNFLPCCAVGPPQEDSGARRVQYLPSPPL